MNTWKILQMRVEREQMREWSSLRRVAYILIPLLIYYVIHDVAEILLWGGLNLYMESAARESVAFLEENGATVRGIINGLAILIGAASIWKAISGEISAPAQKRKETGRERTLTDCFFCGAVSFLAAIGLNLLFSLVGPFNHSASYAETAQAQYGVSFAVGLVLYGVVSPFVEEAIFRGLMYNRMKRCFGFWMAFLLSSLLFGCYHGNLVQALYGTLMGLLIAFLYELFGGFETAVLSHGVANICIYGLTCAGTFKKLSLGGTILLAAVTLCGAAGCIIYMTRKRGKNGLLHD